MMTADIDIGTLSVRRRRGESLIFTLPNKNKIKVTVPLRGPAHFLICNDIAALKAAKVAFKVIGEGKQVQVIVFAPKSVLIERAD